MNSTVPDTWHILNIARTGDEREIKRAYTRQLKLNRPEDDPVAFQRLRDAYEDALRMAAHDQHAASTPSAVAIAAPAADTASMIALRKKDAVPVVNMDGRRSATAPDDIGFAVPDPLKEAASLWQEWLNAAGGLHLKTLEARPVMANFSVREEFERMALRHCATAACHDQTRVKFIAHFQWGERVAQLHAIDAQAAREMLARHHATCSLHHLEDSGRFNTALALLMAPPPSSSRLLANAGLTHQLLELIHLIRWQHPDLLAYKINADAFTWWERQARAKKYFTRTAKMSALGGLALYASCLLMHQLGEFQFAFPHLNAFLLAQAISFALFGAYAFHRPSALLDCMERIKEARFGSWLRHERHQKKWQFGWLALYAAASLLLFVPQPAPFVVYTATLTLAACALLALLSASVQLKPEAYVLLLPLSLLLAYVMQALGFEDFHFAARMAFSLCLVLMLVRSGPQLYAATALPEQWRASLRTVWLLGGTAMFFITATTILPSSVALIAAWLWCLAAMPLYEFKMTGLSRHLIWPALILGKFALFSGVSFFKELPDARMVLPEALLLFIAILILGNLYHAAQQKNIYT